MSFCLGIKVRDGLIGMADTRLISGTERSTAQKVTVHQYGRHSLFLMTSGLRSVRDKALTYFEEMMAEREQTFDKLYKAVNAFGEQIRRVAREDKQALEDGGLTFNLFSLIGGQLEKDSEHRLYMLYPQANWVEISPGTPYYVIGESGYGKPLLDRALRYDTDLETAMKIGYLAFDATRTSATDVDFPVDIVLYRRNAYVMVEKRFEREDIMETADWWQSQMVRLVSEAPASWTDGLFQSEGGRMKEEG